MPELLAGGRIGFGTVWLLGLSMGLTACTVTCLPFMGTWALGRAGGGGEALRHTLSFLAGRVLAYTALAAAAGFAGLGLARALGGAWGNALIAGTSIAAGLWLLAARRGGCAGAPRAAPESPVAFRRRNAAPPFALGASLALTPCTPLAALLALAADTGSGLAGAGYGLAFGLGAALTPILLLVPLAGRLGRELRRGRPWLAVWLRRGAAAVLILLGCRRLLAALF